MPLQTNKYKLYLYLFFFIFLTSIFNFKILDNYQEKFSLKKIYIYGLSNNEKQSIEIELNKLRNINIFKLTEDRVLKTLKKFNFLENIYVNKVIPSTININLSKTLIVGKTLRKTEYFYIGKNGNFIKSNQLKEVINIPLVFGEFTIKEYIDLQNILSENGVDLQNIKKYFYYKNKRWDLLFSNKSTLKLPSQNVDKSIKIYKKLLDSDNLINKKIIDLRITNQIILTNYNE